MTASLRAPKRRLDRDVIDRLLADLMGHDRRTSAFLGHLVILGAAAGGRALPLRQVAP